MHQSSVTWNSSCVIVTTLCWRHYQCSDSVLCCLHYISKHNITLYHACFRESSVCNLPLLLLLVFDPNYARATVMRDRFLAAAFSDGSYLAHVNGAYLRHVKCCIVRGLTPFVHRLAYLSTWAATHFNSATARLVQSPRRRTPASPILV